MIFFFFFFLSADLTRLCPYQIRVRNTIAILLCPCFPVKLYAKITLEDKKQRIRTKKFKWWSEDGIVEDKKPTKVKWFAWLACKNLLPTNFNLAKRSVVAERWCENCKLYEENIVHALQGCEMVCEAWYKYPPRK